jgi:hypothetical protein
MFLLLSHKKKLALARIALGIFGLTNSGRIRTNDPDTYAMFCDFFGVSSQEEILPILQDIMKLDQREAESIAREISNHNLGIFRNYMLSKIPGLNVQSLALASFLQNVGYRP